MSAVGQRPAAVEAPPARNRALEAAESAAGLQRRYPIAQVVALAVLVIVGNSSIEGFLSIFSIRSMLILAALLGIAALGQTVCILIGGLDVSIASWVLAGSTVTVTLLGGVGTQWPVAAVLALLVVGPILIGGAAGYVCHRFNVPSLVMTLAVGAVIQGAVLAWNSSLTGTPPAAIAKLTSPVTKTFGIGMPPVVFIWLGVIVLAYVVLQRSVIGAWVHATGSNPRAAKLALVPTSWVWAGAFALSALAATFTGVLLTGFSAGGDSSVGIPYLWNGLTAVIIGGTSFGAQGDYTRTSLGALLIIVLSQVLVGHGLGTFDQDIVFGGLIVVIVGLYSRDRKLGDQI